MRYLLVVVCLWFGLSMNAFAEDAGEEGVFPKLGLEASGTLDVYSKYVWRGFTLDTDPVVQPGFSVSGYGFTFTFWSSWDADNNDSLDSNELDYTIDYTHDFDDFSVSIGHTYYDFPGIDSFSREVYIGIGTENLFLSPALMLYFDYGDEDQGGGDGTYIALEGSQSFPLIEELGITFDLNLSLAYNDELFINGEGGDFFIGGAVTVPLNNNLAFSPSINYAVPLGDLEYSSDGNQKNRFYYGFSLAYKF